MKKMGYEDLVKFRKKYDLTQTELGELTGFHLKHIQRMEGDLVPVSKRMPFELEIAKRKLEGLGVVKKTLEAKYGTAKRRIVHDRKNHR